MAKQYQKRASYETRKAREDKEKLEKKQAFYDKNKKKIAIIAITALAVIFVGVIACDYFITPGGSIRMFMGQLMDTTDRMLIRNKGTKQSPRYFNFGTMEDPEGYIREEYVVSGDDKETAFYYAFDGTAETGPVRTLLVVGVPNKTGDEMLESIQNSGFYMTMSEPEEGVLAGIPVKYIYLISQTDDKNELFSSMAIYADVLKDSCVLVNCNSFYSAEEELTTKEEILQEAEKIMANLKLPE